MPAKSTTTAKPKRTVKRTAKPAAAKAIPKAAPAKATKAPAKPAPPPSEVAKLRRGGATWQQTRDHFGLKTPSGGFTKALREAGYGPDGLKLDGSGPRESKARVAPRNRTAEVAS